MVTLARFTSLWVKAKLTNQVRSPIYKVCRDLRKEFKEIFTHLFNRVYSTSGWVPRAFKGHAVLQDLGLNHVYFSLLWPQHTISQWQLNLMTKGMYILSSWSNGGNAPKWWMPPVVKQEVEVAWIKTLDHFPESEYFTCQASRCRSKYGRRLFRRSLPIYYRVIMLSSRAKIKRHNTSW